MWKGDGFQPQFKVFWLYVMLCIFADVRTKMQWNFPNCAFIKNELGVGLLLNSLPLFFFCWSAVVIMKNHKVQELTLNIWYLG